MDKEKDILKEFFRDKLQDYAPQVKRDLWSSLESHVPAEKSLWRKIYPVVASAAAVLIVVILSYNYVFEKSPISDAPVAVVTESQAQDISGTVDDQKATKESLNEANTGEQQAYVSKEREKVEKITPEKDLSDNRGDSVLIEESAHEVSVTDNPPRDVIRNRNLENGNNNYAEIKTKRSSSGLQISFSGKGFPSASNELDFLKIYNNDYLSLYDNKFEIKDLFFPGGPTGGKDEVGSWLPAENYSLNNIKYHTPVTLSMYISKNISSRWAIETGISYTMLSSEETWAAERDFFYERVLLYNDIKLHYIGIPLRASYLLIKKDRIFVYLSGGGMIEKSISGKAYTVSDNKREEKNTNIKIRELQYSVTGGVGIGLQLFKPVSLFVEPGVTYYFDDGSGIMTIRKDKPFNYNIQGGLKFHF